MKYVVVEIADQTIIYFRLICVNEDVFQTTFSPKDALVFDTLEMAEWVKDRIVESDIKHYLDSVQNGTKQLPSGLNLSQETIETDLRRLIESIFIEEVEDIKKFREKV